MIGTKELTWRRFRVLLKRLPEDSQFKIGIAEKKRAEAPKSEFDEMEGIAHWPLSDQLMAMQVDLLALANWQRGGGKSGKPNLLSAGTKKTGRPQRGLDVRKALSRGAPVGSGNSAHIDILPTAEAGGFQTKQPEGG